MFHYRPRGTCSTDIALEIQDGVITHCAFTNGCRGNTQGLAAMTIGQQADEVASRLEGIQCRGGTSCPDQLAKAIRAYQSAAAAN